MVMSRIKGSEMSVTAVINATISHTKEPPPDRAPSWLGVNIQIRNNQFDSILIVVLRKNPKELLTLRRLPRLPFGENVSAVVVAFNSRLSLEEQTGLTAHLRALVNLSFFVVREAPDKAVLFEGQKKNVKALMIFNRSISIG